MRQQLYASGLQPVGTGDLKAVPRRASRTNQDSERTLRSVEGAVHLNEGSEVTSGIDAKSSSADSGFGLPKFTPRPHLPPVPTIISPAPSPLAGPPILLGEGGSSSRSSSSQDVFYDAEETERQTNRRSLYRSPGTSSSPDLATLMRKAKERGGVLPVHHVKKEKRRESPPPVPTSPPPFDRAANTGRPRSSTSVNRTPPQGKRGNFASNVHESSGNSEWVIPSPPSLAKGKSTTKSSMRAKTSAFLGKMLGQSGSSVRERSRTDASSPPAPSIPSFSQSFVDSATPPVPPIPAEHQRTASPFVNDASNASNHIAWTERKPLPEVTMPMMQEGKINEDRPKAAVEKVLPSPFETTASVKATKRRSMSVGEAELKLATLTGVPPSPIGTEKNVQEQHHEGTTLNSVLDSFKGELSHLDPIHCSNSKLRTPPHRSQIKLDEAISNSSPKMTETAEKSPVISLQIPSHTLDYSPRQSTTVPPRTSSLRKPRSATRPNSIGPQFVSSARHASSPHKPRTVHPSNPQLLHSRDAARLRTLHRSTASSSEPSLVPVEDAHIPACDLTVNDLTLSRFASNAPSAYSIITGDVGSDVDAQARELASRCWDEDEAFLVREKIAEWLGKHSPLNKNALGYYMENFDFSGLRLDTAFRRLCGKLYLKGETQQVDRILEAFGRRYWNCNLNSPYGNASIVHAVSYSLLLLNTDLHVAELTSRMSRNQFIHNTLAAIRAQNSPDSPACTSTSDLTYDDCSVLATEVRGRSKRSESIKSWSSFSRDGDLSTPVLQDSCTPVQATTIREVKTNSHAINSREWESEMVTLLKEMYNSIKSQQILQPLHSNVGRSSTSLGPTGHPVRHRSYRGQPDRLIALKRGSVRGLQAILNQSGVSPYSSNSSIDGRISPSPSFATSAHEAMANAFMAPTLGFASNLAHTIIRETREDDDRSVCSHNSASTSTTVSITDEELALLGAPWAKEGMLCRKQYWESAGKRARDKTWKNVFVVIQKGELSMFTFGDHSSHATGTFGGGNWLANAEPVGVVHLSHSLSHALPPPGYNRQRPCCMVLTLSNGAVNFFQAGTEELVNEWVSTCNYWAARTSKEPLTGGVSNMEYGWNRVADLPGHKRAHTDGETLKDSSDAVSVRSTRSNRKFGAWKDTAATLRAPQSPWVEKVIINDWKPPQPSTVSSVHDEETQLEALRKHVITMKRELEQHNDLREPMTALYQPRTANATKAMTNWERKSQYLLAEIVKYESYIDSLQNAMSLRLKKRGERALEKALNGADPTGDSPTINENQRTPETIQENEQAISFPAVLTTGQHKRETAEGGERD